MANTTQSFMDLNVWKKDWSHLKLDNKHSGLTVVIII